MRGCLGLDSDIKIFPISLLMLNSYREKVSVLACYIRSCQPTAPSAKHLYRHPQQKHLYRHPQQNTYMHILLYRGSHLPVGDVQIYASQAANLCICHTYDRRDIRRAPVYSVPSHRYGKCASFSQYVVLSVYLIEVHVHAYFCSRMGK